MQIFHELSFWLVVFFLKWNHLRNFLLPGIRTKIPINSSPKVSNFSARLRVQGVQFKGHCPKTIPFCFFDLQHSVINKLSIKAASFMCTINRAAFMNYVDVPFYRIREFSSDMTTFNLVSQVKIG